MNKNRDEEISSVKEHLELMHSSFKYAKNESIKDKLKSYGKYKITLNISIIVGFILSVVNIVFLFHSFGIIEKIVASISVVSGVFILILSFLIAKKNKELVDYFSDLFMIQSENSIGLFLMFFGIVNLFI